MHKKLNKIIILLIVLLGLGYFIYNCIFKKKAVDDVNSSEYVQKIDSLESIIDSLSIKKELLDKEIDTIYLTVYKNTQKYEENRNIILDNDIFENYEFFSKYISRYKSRYDSINNF